MNSTIELDIRKQYLSGSQTGKIMGPKLDILKKVFLREAVDAITSIENFSPELFYSIPQDRRVGFIGFKNKLNTLPRNHPLVVKWDIIQGNLKMPYSIEVILKVKPFKITTWIPLEFRNFVVYPQDYYEFVGESK